MQLGDQPFLYPLFDLAPFCQYVYYVCPPPKEQQGAQTEDQKISVSSCGKANGTADSKTANRGVFKNFLTNIGRVLRRFLMMKQMLGEEPFKSFFKSNHKTIKSYSQLFRGLSPEQEEVIQKFLSGIMIKYLLLSKVSSECVKNYLTLIPVLLKGLRVKHITCLKQQDD